MKALMIALLSLSGLLAAETDARQERELKLGTLVSGVVAEVKVREGQQVRAGAVLVVLDQRAFQARLNRTRAVASRAAALFAEALREEKRARELYDRGLLSDHELQQAQIGRLEAEARKAEAGEEETQARLDLERSRILAPRDGRVMEVKTWKGQPVQNALSIQTLIVLGVKEDIAAKTGIRLP
jgi:multidrug efflux system membrane fusion protein